MSIQVRIDRKLFSALVNIEMNQSFGLQLNAMRNARSISADNLSQHTGITAADLKKLENGTMFASRDQVFRLASYFDVNESEFLRLNQATRITAETSGKNEPRFLKKTSSVLSGNAPLRSKRLDNMKRDLDLLKARTMTVKLHMPIPQLRPFVESIVYCEGHDLGYPFECTLPDGTTQLQIVIGEGGRDVVSQHGKQVKRVNRAWVMGMNSIPVTYRLSEVKGIIYVRFKPAGLYAFTRIHQAELSNLVVDARKIFGSSFHNLWENIARCNQPKQMISRIEVFFIEKLINDGIQPAMLTYMLDHIQLPLPQLAKKTGYSAKYLTKTFQRYIGVGPKTFQRIQRFSASICDLNHLTERVDWAELVFQHAYHDQAHFIKDFKYFSGHSPQHYLALAPSCPRYLHTTHLPTI